MSLKFPDHQTLEIAKFVYHPIGERQYVCRELSNVDLQDMWHEAWYHLVYLGFDFYSYGYQNIRFRAYKDKHKNIVIRYTRPKLSL